MSNENRTEYVEVKRLIFERESSKFPLGLYLETPPEQVRVMNDDERKLLEALKELPIPFTLEAVYKVKKPSNQHDSKKED